MAERCHNNNNKSHKITTNIYWYIFHAPGTMLSAIYLAIHLKLTQPYEIGTIFIILQMRKLGLLKASNWSRLHS